MTVDADALRTLLAGFLAGRASQGTRDAYRRDLAHLAAALAVPEAVPDDEHIAGAFGIEDDPAVRDAARALAALPPDWWADWRDALEGSPATRRRRVAAVRAFCRWWSRALDTENPVRDLRPPGGGGVRRGRPGQEVVALAPAATRRLCEAARRPGPLGARDAALVEVLYGCGLRASEASSLDVSRCHLDDADDPYVVVTGKGAKVRAVAVPVAARDALVAYLRVARPRLRAAAGRGARGDADAVFLSARGRRLGRADIWRVVTRAASRAGLTDDGGRVFPHALRHSCGTHLIQAGVDIRYVQAHLGHASPVTTEVYTHVTAAHLKSDFDRAHPRARASAQG
ncbi:MAG: tyrosine-type recombinase/integrase [Thermoleophilia bacterium]|nr:tyrosine-type recombinase/integrase [Thermoleophilia bacterium]